MEPYVRTIFGYQVSGLHRSIRSPCRVRTDDLILTKDVRYHCANGEYPYVSDRRYERICAAYL